MEVTVELLPILTRKMMERHRRLGTFSLEMEHEFSAF